MQPPFVVLHSAEKKTLRSAPVGTVRSHSPLPRPFSRCTVAPQLYSWHQSQADTCAI